MRSMSRVRFSESAQVAVVQEEADAVDVRVLVKMIDARRVEGARATDDAVDFVTFLEQQIREVANRPGR